MSVPDIRDGLRCAICHENCANLQCNGGDLHASNLWLAAKYHSYYLMSWATVR